jgi:hypothetical protein
MIGPFPRQIPFYHRVPILYILIYEKHRSFVVTKKQTNEISEYFKTRKRKGAIMKLVKLLTFCSMSLFGLAAMSFVAFLSPPLDIKLIEASLRFIIVGIVGVWMAQVLKYQILTYESVVSERDDLKSN